MCNEIKCAVQENVQIGCTGNVHIAAVWMMGNNGGPSIRGGGGVRLCMRVSLLCKQSPGCYFPLLQSSHVGRTLVKLLTVTSHCDLITSILCSCGSVVEHCVSSAKGCGFDSQGTHLLMKMYNLNVIVSHFG